MKKIVTRILLLLMVVSLVSPSAMALSLPANSSNPGTSATSEPDPAAVKAAVKEFRSLPRRERKTKIREAKKMLKDYKAQKKAGHADEADIVLLAILAILLPPLAVYLKEGEVNSRFWVSLILTLLFWIPGVIFALLVVFDAI